MNLAERAAHLAAAIARFDFLTPVSGAELCAIFDQETGGEKPGANFPRTITHILSGNTPAAALQSLVRGLLIGASNRVKLPSCGLPEVGQFLDALPAGLAALVETSAQLDERWLTDTDAVIVFGSDETVAAVRAQVPDDVIFAGYGHRISIGIVADDAAAESAAAAAQDVAAFDQTGCLSPLAFYVGGDARAYAAALAVTLEREEKKHPRQSVPPAIAARIRELRQETRFRTACGEACEVWASEGSTAWTVIFDCAPGFPASPLHRFIHIKPLAQLDADLAPVRGWMSCCGFFPANAAALAATTGASRLCPLGEMQRPPWSWQQDGQPALGRLVRA